MSDPYNPDWKDIEIFIHGLKRNVDEANFKPDYIIGLTRGGLIPATMLSHLLDVPMIAIQYSSVDGAGDNKNHDNELPDIKGKSLLIVDDIADSGKTLEEVCTHFAPFNVLQSAVLYHKESSVFTPSFCALLIPEDAPFVYFPWEIKD